VSLGDQSATTGVNKRISVNILVLYIELISFLLQTNECTSFTILSRHKMITSDLPVGGHYYCMDPVLYLKSCVYQ